MALVLADRVQQTGTANTTVSFTLSGSVNGFQSFAVVGNGNTTYYSATDQSGNWEVGIGTYSTTGPTLTRTTVIASSNTGAAVTFVGTVNAFITQPAENTVVSSNNPGSSTYVLTSNGTGVAPSWQPGGAGTLTTTDFTATAGQTVFTVNYVIGFVSVYRNGIKLGNADYTATDGTTITLATGAIVGDLIEVQSVSNLNLYSTITYQDFSGTGSQTAFTMSVSPPNAASVLVAISGVVQDPVNYTVAGTTLTFTTAPAAGTNNISVRYLGIPTTGAVASFSGGTTGLTPSTATTGAVTLAGTLAVANGGTGLTSPGTSGNLLTSNGTAWTSTAPAPGVLSGTIQMWPTATPPSGYALCDGTAVSRTTYAALFAVVGTTFGTGDGATTFNLPDYRGRSPLGVSGSYALATTGGSADAIVPSHTHGITDPTHSHSLPGTILTYGNPSGGSGVLVQISSMNTGAASTGITVNTAGVSPTGANLQPYLAINFIIKT